MHFSFAPAAPLRVLRTCPHAPTLPTRTHSLPCRAEPTNQQLRNPASQPASQCRRSVRVSVRQSVSALTLLSSAPVVGCTCVRVCVCVRGMTDVVVVASALWLLLTLTHQLN